MPFVFIDYTDLYFSVVGKAAIPAKTGGKFVRIRNEADDYLVFSPKEFAKYHANILERFCLDRGLEGNYDPEGKRYDIADRSWVVLGGGTFEVDREGKKPRLFDDSMAYGKFETQGLKEAISSL